MISIYNRTAIVRHIVVRGRVVSVPPTGAEVGCAAVSPKEAEEMVKREPTFFTLNYTEARGDGFLFESPFKDSHNAVLETLTAPQLTGVIRFLTADKYVPKDEPKAELLRLAREAMAGLLPQKTSPKDEGAASLKTAKTA
jgi:hypothetical protein